MGTGSAFFLYNLEDFDEYMDVFDHWNALTAVPSLGQDEEHESDLYTKMSKEYLGEEWLPYQEFNLDDEYHKYEIEWTPQYLAYKVDGVEIRRKEGVDGLDREQNLGMAFLAINSDEAGAGWDDSEMPYYTFIDYVEVYHYDAGENSFWLNFRDDFDRYDPERWDRADDITWDEKDSIFKQENAYIMNGHLELKLSKNADYHHDDDHHDDDGEHSDDDSHDDDDFHVLPAPKDGTLDAAIEKATRVGVVMVRQYLDHFSESMSHALH